MHLVLTAVLFYVGLCALLTLEEAGVFLLPGDISLVAAGVYAARGGPFIGFSWLAASVGMVLGSAVLFFSVRRSRTTKRILPVRARWLIRRHGAYGVALARLVPGLRNATVLAAASASLRPRVFMTGLIPAAVLWSGVLLLAGYLGGEAILSTLGTLEGAPLMRFISVSFVIAVATFAVFRLRSLTVRKQPGA